MPFLREELAVRDGLLSGKPGDAVVHVWKSTGVIRISQEV